MTAGRYQITPSEILPLEVYARLRAQKRREALASRRNRRVSLGPSATVLFENYDTMWLQVHEMLYLDREGAEPLPRQLATYNPLIPQGRELVATALFATDDAARRRAMLERLSGVEQTFFLELGDQAVSGRPEPDPARPAPGAKASAVQFIHFELTPEQIARFTAPDTQVVLGIDHPAYAHRTVLPEAVRTELAHDFG